jgi:hypothetical protein
MVRFQALRQFSSLTEEWPLDFVRLDGPSGDQVRVLAATVAPGVIDEARRVCAAIPAAPTHLVLRPFASSSLFCRRGDDGRCRVLVEFLSDEADLTVLVAGQAVLLRSVRLPAEDRTVWLAGELRRTIAAARNQMVEPSVQAVTLVGDPQELEPLRAALAEQLKLDVTAFDPFDEIGRVGESAGALPPDQGRYAALLGMLRDTAEGCRHGIDFLNPRRRPLPPSRRRWYTLGAAAAVLFLLVLGSMYYLQFRHCDQQWRSLQEAGRSLDEPVKIAEKLKADIEEVDVFIAGDVNWLDELYQLSHRFPPPEDAIVELASFNSVPAGGGQILLDGYVREPSVIEKLENQIRDSQHAVTGSGAQFDESRKEFRWGFKEKIVIPPVAIEEVPADDET